MRDLRLLPKAHLHLHLTGGMRPATLVELAAEQGRRLPPELLDPDGTRVDVSVRRGWSRFQRLYDAAREVVTARTSCAGWSGRSPRTSAPPGRAGWRCRSTRRRTPRGWVVCRPPSRWCSTRCGPPSGTPASAWAWSSPPTAPATRATRRRWPGSRGGTPGSGVVGFGLSNDETKGPPELFEKAFRIAREAGLLAVPHAGELRGTRSVVGAVHVLGAHRLGHGVRAVEDPAVLALLAERQVVLEVCPASNVALGVAGAVEQVPVRQLQAAGVPVALGADDPLLFRSGLLAQYEAVRAEQHLSDEALAALAADAVRGSAAPAGGARAAVTGGAGVARRTVIGVSRTVTAPFGRRSLP